MPITLQSLWQASTNNPFTGQALAHHAHADVAIIGGGYGGLSAALELAKSGLDVHLLEAQTIGFGGSGRNVGLVNAGLWTPPDDIEATLGQAAGQKLNQAFACAPDMVFDLIQKYQIDCNPVRHGTLHCATNKSGLKDLNRRFLQQQKRQAPVELLSASATMQRTGSSEFLGALFDARAGTIQPLSYAFGLAHAAVKAGASINTQSAVLDYRYQDKQWHIFTAQGRVSANQLIVATNAYGTQNDAQRSSRDAQSQAPQSQTKGYFTPIGYCQFATAPLTLKQQEEILPHKEGCWDTAHAMSSFRLDHKGRLIIGGVGSLEHRGSSTHMHWAQRKLKALFPELKAYEFDYMWSGQIAMTADKLPKMCAMGPQAISLYGYSGRGIGPATTLGCAAAKWAMGLDEIHLPLAISDPTMDCHWRLKSAYYNTGALLAHWFESRL
ncbi:NAD(P)/FAD-dependent oxidoreductase [Candidatus Njordibacter sp. Uisw_058]|uniref:NAD(P)/FAD-dependent oxidoreductase n=1 Tax=Candidatus Njordibacter sp. Uisw_058 TaxID=3230974 RepID=UPI003D503648